jgi:hypothetical protein
VRERKENGRGRKQQVRKFPTCTPQQLYSGNHINQDETGGVCGTYGGEGKGIHGFGADI